MWLISSSVSLCVWLSYLFSQDEEGPARRGSCPQGGDVLVVAEPGVGWVHTSLAGLQGLLE